MTQMRNQILKKDVLKTRLLIVFIHDSYICSKNCFVEEEGDIFFLIGETTFATGKSGNTLLSIKLIVWYLYII